LQLIYDCIDVIALKLSIKGLKIEINIDPKLDYIESDPNRLKQILTNLLTNAEKHTIQGKIIINVHKIFDDSVIFMVKDTGIGMDKP